MNWAGFYFSLPPSLSSNPPEIRVINIIKNLSKKIFFKDYLLTKMVFFVDKSTYCVDNLLHLGITLY